MPFQSRVVMIMSPWQAIDADIRDALRALVATKLGVETSEAVASLALRSNSSDEQPYAAEHAESRSHFVEALRGAIPRPCALRQIEMFPCPYVRDRFALPALRAAATAVSSGFRIHPIILYEPAVEGRQDSLGGRIEASVENGLRRRFWSLRTSGYVFVREVLPDVHCDSTGGRQWVLDAYHLAADIAETVHALLGFYAGRLHAETRVHCRFALFGVQGWRLSDRVGEFHSDHSSIGVDRVLAAADQTLAEWEASPLDLAVEIFRTCCGAFHWRATDFAAVHETMADAIYGVRRRRPFAQPV